MPVYDDAERLTHFKALICWFLGWAFAGWLYEHAHFAWSQAAAAVMVAVCVVMTVRSAWLWRRAVNRNPRPKQLD